MRWLKPQTEALNYYRYDLYDDGDASISINNKQRYMNEQLDNQNLNPKHSNMT